MITHIFEYDDFELDGLLNDLNDLGILTLSGWIIIWDGEYDLPRTEIIIAPSERDALAIYLHRGYFGPDFQKKIRDKYKNASSTNLTKFIKDERNIKPNLELWFNILARERTIRKFTIIDSLLIRNEIKSPSYTTIEENPDPYHQIEIFDKLFTNSKERFEKVKKFSRTNKNLTVIQLNPNEYGPDNRIKNGGWI